jgi:hypothetical protein
MASRVTVNDVLDGHVVLDLDCDTTDFEIGRRLSNPRCGRSVQLIEKG